MEDVSHKNYEQLELLLQFKDELNVVARLNRCKEPLISKVEIDAATNRINDSFDFEFDGTNKFYPFEFHNFLKELKDFNILCIVGASGAGKSTFAKYYGQDEKLIWDNNKCILSNIDDNVDLAIEKLCATGLNSIPTWTKPYNVLSVGERFRASLARKLKNNCVIDEFTSNVDRNVALSCSTSIGKYIRKHNLKNCVFVSCHKDFIDCLCPDYIIDLDDAVIYDSRRLVRRKFKLSIYEKTNKLEIWNLFKRHHYLSADLNQAAKCFTAYLNDELVACCYVLPQMGGTVENAWRVHRLVVLPDYQGLGIATKFLNYICDMFKYHNKTVYLRTSHIKLIQYMLKSDNWLGDGKLMHSKVQKNIKYYNVNEKRLSASFKYVSECTNNPNYAYDKISFIVHNENNYEQLLLFEEEKPIVKQTKTTEKVKKVTIKDVYNFDIDLDSLLEAGLIEAIADENTNI